MDPEIKLTEPGGTNGTESQALKGNVIIFPGGAYRWHSPREAEPVANAFAGAGWKPWILYYPVNTPDAAPTPLGLAPLRHAAAAVKQVRGSYPELPVVLCGFSAGGHAAATLGVHWNDEAVFSLEEQPLIRPDALILSYPVITAGPWTHVESIEMLAGEIQDVSERPGSRGGLDAPERSGSRGGGQEVSRTPNAAYFSLEHHVTAQTPPTFLWHTASDEMVPVQNSLLFAEHLAAAGVPFELHVYPHGPHGLSLATPEVEEPAKHRYADPYVAAWFDQCIRWLNLCQASGIIPTPR